MRAIEKCCFAASGVVSLAAAVAMALFPGQIAALFVAAGAAVVVFLQAIGMYDTPLWRLVGAVAGTALGL